jgi:hypothetical protein
MVEHKCERCKRVWHRKFEYDRHKGRKNPCEIAVEKNDNIDEDQDNNGEYGIVEYNFNGDIYCLADDVYKDDPLSFPGCSKTSRLIVSKKKLQESDYLYKKIVADEWKDSNGEYKKSKLFIKKSWLQNNIGKYKKEKNMEDLKIDGMRAPDILELEDDEKFKDMDGNILDIEVRGQRKFDEIYFKVKDIGEKFKIGNNVNKILTNETSSFEEGKHYVNFIICQSSIDELRGDKKITKYLFLTFTGLTKLLYCSRSGNAEHFQKWANNILFKHSFGSEDDKQELASELIGTHPKSIKQLFSKNTSKTPCVYLYCIGSARDLIGDEYHNGDMLYKYGCTDDLPRRAQEHNKTYHEEFGVDISLSLFSIVDPKYIFDAESDIRAYTKPYSVEYKNMEELVVLDKTTMKTMKKLYMTIQNSYIGCYQEMENKMKSLEKEKDNLNQLINQEKNNVLLRDKDVELKDKEIELKDKEIESKNKEIEMLKKKLNKIKKQHT